MSIFVDTYQRLVDSSYARRCTWNNAQPTWQEEFDDPKLPRWGKRQHDWGSNYNWRYTDEGQPVYYTDDCVTVDNGILSLAGYSYDGLHCGVIDSACSQWFHFGRFEIRAKVANGPLPTTKSNWWFLGEGWPPEIDALEMPMDGNPYQTTHSIHWRTGPDTTDYQTIKVPYWLNRAWFWCHYGMEWYPNRVTFFVNGSPVGTITRNVPQHPMAMLLSTEMRRNACRGGLFQVQYARYWAA